MPKNTRVGRCVGKLTRKYGYTGAIAICQKSTKQNYMTGKKLKSLKKKRKKKRGGVTRRKKRRHRWSRKYKKSINCKRPKGFSQKQYCKYGRKHK